MSLATSKTTFDHAVLLLRQAVGSEAVLTDAASRAFYANDIFWQPGVQPEAIVLPSTQRQAADAIRIAGEAGMSIVPRGGGMSYSKGYLPAAAGAVVVDATKLNRIVEVNPADRYITVEAGCTWAEVNAALEGTGLRTAYWGPLSGRKATVGGALSQNSAFFGSTTHGTVGESVIGLTVVLADGTLVTTGSAGRQNTKPFTREGGPDMTGLFVGDNGALGFKVAATLRLNPRPEHVGYLSFGFASIAAMARAQVEMSMLDAVSEGFGIDRTKVEHSASVNKLMDGVKTLGAVAQAGSSLLGGLKAATQIAAAGTSFLKEHAFTLHLVVEGRTAGALDDAMAAVRAAGRRHGVEIANTVPTVMRATPFGPPRGMLGKDGERWVPIHAVFPMSTAVQVCDANDAFFAAQAAFMREHGILYSVMTMTVGAEFFLEPAFYWHDEITPLHARTLGEDVVGPWMSRPANEKSRLAVATLRRKTQELYASLGGVSWQAARDYPFREIMKPETYGLLTSLKRAVDPKGLMNPGALGLD
ncbi:MAG: FAD-binding oxidoreductase [Hyphomicrobiales bacterium]|nr:FAD-binding oxidoreductase [Hyphomicrobiales bacterium]